MNELRNFEVQVLSSLEVAKMVGKEHSKLLRDIRRYISQINEANFGLVNSTERKIALDDSAEANFGFGDQLKIEPSDFFRESTYTDTKGETRPCFDVTKKGCEFIAHKLTGTKGTIFTARYINKFYDMEQELANTTRYIEDRRKCEEIFEKWELSPLLPPPKKSWYERNKLKIKTICEYFGWNRKYLYHKILTELGTRYDLSEAKRIYIRENGFPPYYATEIIEYFPELQEIADKYINYLLEG